VLEHGYLNRVERAHRLPAGRRQNRVSSADGTIYRDVTYDDFGLVVELDGRLWHDNVRARSMDMDRDLDAAVDRQGTVRISWGQTMDTPCATAGKLSRLLQARGWRGAATSCGPGCALSGHLP
jgi:hypothetical protein